ncbi:hypothetical protein MHK_007833 [Candidatus Magnetomorum sp. HK-1]|nr:hypothetical protein MHK_007833 [Candidatus Magnetomorum sp. HK-1]
MDIQNLQTSSSINMKIFSSNTNFQTNKNINNKDETNTDSVDITMEIMEFRKEIQIKTLNTINEQSAVAAKSDDLKEIDWEKYTYKGKPITELSQEEAQGLIEDDGSLSVKNTSQRIADFVIATSGDDIEMLKAGREGILKGFDEAEEFWGDILPDIAYDTLNAALKMIDEKLSELGDSVINFEA